MKTLIIYHKNCFDGICAAWVAKRKFSDADILPANYGEPFPDVSPKDNIVIVDFSYPREVMIEVSHVCELLVIDHHKTAEKACEGLNFCKFDMNESGASLAWKTFFPDEPIPVLVRYIKDRDLWLFKEEYSEEINSYIQSFPMTIENYEELYDELENSDGRKALVGGRSILRYKQTMVEAMCKNMVMKDVGGYIVPVVNASILFSEVGSRLCEMAATHGTNSEYGNHPFAAYYFDRLADNTRQWGLRSIGDFDVSEVAKKFGGGGHRNAAGFQEKI